MFRAGNVSLRDAAVHGGMDETPIPFLCECADVDCLGDVAITPTAWASVSERPHHFVMIEGHQRSEGEEVVGHLGEYEIARKPS